ncbi:HAM1 protein [Liquorilactobacillus ghanensis DSM 18630]|uniref:dITP/XTP pyrophosphatase n=1 Tax=Liquorilactobacillus ghanensis DSM 18630 TaxID=1423750 RepID=A0A0R1VRF9_9LACO|nr:XTP/dITP diphosphatase [Liquorilactobacillus ghanensis]KRM06459.1 HAM1 protein [Liquorilactobacillus ghanensis DSM 18630]
MKRILIATQNKGKAREFRAFFEPRAFEVLTLNDLDEVPPIVENGASFTENAMIKAQTLTDLLGTVTLADDSGLMVAALDGRPGIHSARYAGDHDDAANNAKLLRELAGISQRDAVFHTSLVVTRPKRQPLTVSSEVKGTILTGPRGKDGFGYDPLFYLPELGKTFAELTSAEKNQVSHRGKAIQALNQKFDGWWQAGEH